MIIEATGSDFNRLKQGQAPGSLRLEAGTALGPPSVLEMLGKLADVIAGQFKPSAWMMVEGDEIVGLMSVIRLPGPGEIHIGYGVAPTLQGRGAASRAVADLVAWARQDERVACISADTGVDNIASQRVLQRNGFARIGTRVDEEDGPLICWRIETA